MIKNSAVGSQFDAHMVKPVDGSALLELQDASRPSTLDVQSPSARLNGQMKLVSSTTPLRPRAVPFLADETIGDNTLDIAYVGDRLLFDPLRRDRSLPNHTFRLSRASRSPAATDGSAGPRVMRAVNSPAVQVVHRWSSKNSSRTNRMYFTPAWMFGSSWAMSPTFCSLPVAGISCMTPTAPTWLLAPWSRRDSW